MSASAKANREKFYIGIDANVRPLEKLSTKITRKPAKGGLANAMFVQAAVEDLPAEFDGIASEIFVNFPWGSLLRAVATGDEKALASLGRLTASDARLTVTIGVDEVRDRSEFERLGVSGLAIESLQSSRLPLYSAAGFRSVELRQLAEAEWSRIESTWARKLGGKASRKVFQLSFVRF